MSYLFDIDPYDFGKSDLLSGDCGKVLQTLPSDSVQLIVSSPSYADARKNTYGGVPPEKYVDWFLPISAELFRVLKPTGTFILNLKEKVVDGERSTYVLDLIKALRCQGWRFTEEFIWSKRNATPGKWPNRFRDAWERLLQFNKQRRFDMYQDAVMIEASESTKRRAAHLCNNDRKRTVSTTGSGFTRKMANFQNRHLVYPSNVLSLPTESRNRNHSAAFPEALPTWFIKLFSQRGDTVLDPFAGAGTTGVACRRLLRRFIGIEIKQEYLLLARERIDAVH